MKTPLLSDLPSRRLRQMLRQTINAYGASSSIANAYRGAIATATARERRAAVRERAKKAAQ